MKSAVLVLVGALVAVEARPFVEKRALTTEVVYVTEVADTVVVFVDEDGEAYSTTTEARSTSMASTVVSTTTSVVVQTSSSSQVLSTFATPIAPAAPSSTSASPSLEFTSVKKEEAPTSSPAPYVAPSSSQEVTSSSTPPPPAPSSQTPSSPAAPVLSQTPSSSAAPAPSPSSAPSQTGGDSGVLGLGVTYDPFTGNSGSSQAGCKSEDQFADDFNKMKDYKVVRLYGMGCNQIPLAVKAAIKQNQKLMAGTYLSSGTDGTQGEDLGASIRAWKSAIDRYAGGNWDVVVLFSVENERVNSHDMTASAVVDAINQARSQLRAAGYNGPVGAVETVPAMVDNPAICGASDVVMVNCHAFFDSNTSADGAGKFVRSEIDRVGKACGGKRVVVTESGWPHQGDPNGKAIASPANQKTALETIQAEFSAGDMFLHHAFDDMWKSNGAATFNAEQYWGIIQ